MKKVLLAAIGCAALAACNGGEENVVENVDANITDNMMAPVDNMANMDMNNVVDNNVVDNNMVDNNTVNAY